MAKLEDLPNELLIQIASHLGDIKASASLRNLALVSKRFCPLVLDILYRSIRFGASKAGSLIEALTTHPNFAQKITSITLLDEKTAFHLSHIDMAPKKLLVKAILTKVPNLVELEVNDETMVGNVMNAATYKSAEAPFSLASFPFKLEVLKLRGHGILLEMSCIHWGDYASQMPGLKRLEILDTELTDPTPWWWWSRNDQTLKNNLRAVGVELKIEGPH